jgi:monodictyphenone polyketide synthase
MSCRFPGGADDPDLFWELLAEGRDVHRKVPPDRYDVDSHTDPTGERRNTSLTPFGCFINEPGLFDAGFFNMSPREAAGCDPMHRLALVTAYEALEQSGYSPNRTPSTNQKRVATFYGQASDDYREVNSGQDVDTYFIPGGCRAFAPGRINYFFKFSGPSFDCDTACSSSLATIQIACTSLNNGDSDMVVAGGLNVLTNSDGFAGLSRGHFLSKTGGCKTWDVDADGYCRADGIGSIIMKRLPDAEADNDNILAVIAASATNHSAEAISITHPHAPTQSDLYRCVLGRAGVHPRDVDLVELHGTGTQAGDATEMESVTSVFAPASPRRKQALYIGAVKGNVGHGEAAAGIMALIKTVLVFKNSRIPPHVGVKTALNPKFPDLDKLHVKIPWEATPWERSSTRKRYAVVNNFSAAGGNTTLLVEEPPIREPPSEADPRSAFVVVLSARSKKSFKSNIERLLTHLDSNPAISLPDLSYTTTARRLHHNHRIAVSGQTVHDIKKALSSYLPSADTQRPVSSTPPSVAFIFSGQGTIHSGLARQLFTSHQGFRAHIQQLDDICCNHGFPSFLPVITDTESTTFEPIVNHLALVSIGIALVRLYATIGVRPSVVMGASLGEYAALYAAGVLSASDTLLLTGRRAQLLQNKCAMNTHAMLAIRTTESQVKEHANGVKYELAAHNGRQEVCISGTVEDIVSIRGHLEKAGYQCHQLNVPFAFHSTQMDPILDDFETTSEAAIFKAPNVPVISSLLGECVFDDKTINANYMRRATRETVQFIPAVDKAWEMGIVDSKTIWIEIGPQPTFVQFIKNAIPEISLVLPTLRRGEDNMITLSATVGLLYGSGIDINWVEWHRPFEKQLRLLDNLPAYSWSNKNYWIQYAGDWMLTKNQAPTITQNAGPVPIPSTLRTSLIHQVLEETVSGEAGYLVVRSDLMQPEFLEAANGHRMNGHGVVTSVSYCRLRESFLSLIICTQSIHADISFTLAQHLYSLIRPGSKCSGMNVRNFHVLEGLIVRKNRAVPQQIEIIATADFNEKLSVQLEWFNVHSETGDTGDVFATGEVEFGANQIWLDEWSSRTHLVTSRIEALDSLADQGIANRLSRGLVYTLFANLVDYADRYRGMQQVVLNGMEASAKVVLTTDVGGTWTVAPHHIDSVAHLAGFILNGGNACDPRNNFFVTPGWKSMRIAKPLVPGGKYQSYVRMVPQAEPGFYAGDVYVLQNAEIIGLVEGIQFRTFPRLLLGKLFSPSDLKLSGSSQGKPVDQNRKVTSALIPKTSTRPATEVKQEPKAVGTKPVAEVESSETSTAATTTEEKPPISTPGSEPMDAVMALIATETSMDLAELNDESEFAAIGVDSLLSLVLAEKFRDKLGIEVKSSLFIECANIAALKEWLCEYS